LDYLTVGFKKKAPFTPAKSFGQKQPPFFLTQKCVKKKWRYYLLSFHP
jgi:hypothetical protein